MRITPKSNAFYPLFAEAGATILQGSQALEAVVLASRIERPAAAEHMHSLENQADEITHQILSTVNQTFVTPFDREDIYRLAAALDDVMDEMDSAADLMLLYGVDPMPSEFQSMVDVIKACATLTEEAMPRLQTMADLEPFWIEINRLENQGDQVFRRTLAWLMSGELDTLLALKLKDILIDLEASIDAFEKVAHTVESIAVKES